MTSHFDIKFSGSSSPDSFDSWFEEEHGTGMFEIESDVDETVEDDYSEDA
jgi:hypothetical protein